VIYFEKYLIVPVLQVLPCVCSFYIFKSEKGCTVTLLLLVTMAGKITVGVQRHLCCVRSVENCYCEFTGCDCKRI